MSTIQDDFISLCKSGDLNAVKNFIKHHAKEIDIHDDDESALNEALGNGHLNIIKYLIEEHQANIHGWGSFPQEYSASKGYLNVIKYLTEECHVDIHYKNQTTLQFAIGSGHLNIVKYLTEDPQVNIHLNEEDALRRAAEKGHLNIVKYLIEEHQADIHAKGEYALQKSAKYGYLEVVLCLIDHGANYEILKKNEDTLDIYKQIKNHLHEKQQQIQKLNLNVIKSIPTRKAVRRRPASLQM